MIYLDNNTTTAMSEVVIQQMRDDTALLSKNPTQWEDVLEQSKRRIRLLLGIDSGQILLTSGGTENAALFLHGLQARHVVASPLEHISVLSHDSMEMVITQVPLTAQGEWQLPVLETVLKQGPGVVATTVVNSETGVITDVAAVAALTKKVSPQTKVFVDACQVPGKFRFGKLPEAVDAVSISAHKFHGPPGVGALWLRDGIELVPILSGGFQQNSYRGGMPNVIGGCGLIAALTEVTHRDDFGSISRLRHDLDELILCVPDVELNYADAALAPNTSNYHVHGVRGDVLALLLRKLGVIVSHTSSGLKATNAGTALMQYLYPEGGADQNVRFSLSRYNTTEEIRKAANVFGKAVKELRRL